MQDLKKTYNFVLRNKQGSMSEWLGTGLQNRSHQFESGWNLELESTSRGLFFYDLISFSTNPSNANHDDNLGSMQNFTPATYRKKEAHASF